jgi:MarR family transcriptional regulator, organic hydroperoxide resistance regulator
MNDDLSSEVQIITDHLNAIRAILRRGSQADMSASGLTAPQVNLLRALSFLDGSTLKQLSERLHLAHSTISGMVDRLEQKKLVERQVDAQDKRYTRIYLGREVRDYLNHTMPSNRASLLVEALTKAQPAEREQILGGLETLHRYLQAGANSTSEKK